MPKPKPEQKQKPKPDKPVRVPKYKFTVRGLAAAQPFRETASLDLTKALVKARIPLTSKRTHVADRLMQHGPKNGIDTLGAMVKAWSRSTPVRGTYKGRPTFYSHLKSKLWLVMSLKGQLVTVRYDPKQAELD